VVLGVLKAGGMLVGGWLLRLRCDNGNVVIDLFMPELKK